MKACAASAYVLPMCAKWGVGGHVCTSCISVRKPAECLDLVIKQVWPMALHVWEG